ncbi:MAG: IS66 family transposase [Ketobacter sp.]|nr:IS66 family transposase [Ketobacter sp.]
MQLKDHDLQQLNREYLASLSSEQLLDLAEKLLNDLRDARDRQNQTPDNSSRPSGSYAPWEQASISARGKQRDEAESKEGGEGEPEARSTEKRQGEAVGRKKRKPGKQKGAKGFGRKVSLPLTGEEVHKAEMCAGCGQELAEAAPFVRRTGSYTLDIKKGGLGLEVSNVLHIYGVSECQCGHGTESKPGRCEAEAEWGVEITEWHLVGPMLASLIICLSLRMRQSRPRIQEFLADWLGIRLSKGCISQCIAEGGRAAAPLEAEFVAEIEQAELLHVDETGWKENGKTAWLWVMATATVTYYLIGSRSWNVIAAIMEHFAGWLMSDGYGQYRKYGQRLRCLAHLIRKARGLGESCHPEAAEFGQQVLESINLFINGVYEARGDPTIDLRERYEGKLAELKALCQEYRDHEHEKSRKLARELLNDWEAIWNVLQHPQMPLTNNLAERALRHWVISRKISHGTRTQQGSRVHTILASVIDTCRQRGVSPWDYLAQIIEERRKNNPVPPLPASVV